MTAAAGCTTRQASIDTSPPPSPAVLIQEEGLSSVAGTSPGNSPFALNEQNRAFASALSGYSRGLILAETTPYADESMAEFERLIALYPDNVEIALRTANTYRIRGKYDDALRILDALRKLHPRNNTAIYLAAVAYGDAGRNKDAMKAYELLISRSRSEAQGYIGLANTYLKISDDEKAFKILNNGLKHAQNRDLIVQVCRSLAGQYINASRLPEAIMYLETACSAETNDLATSVSLLGAYLTSERYDDAGRFERELETQYGDNPVFHNVASLLFMESGRFEEAYRSFGLMEQYAANYKGSRDELLDAGFYFQYGAASERIGKYEDAAALFEKCIAMEPGNHQALNYLAYMWADRNINLDRALEYVTTALKQEPDNPAYLDTIGWILYRQGKHRDALSWIQRARTLMPDDPVIADHIGDIFEALNQHKEALAMWQMSFKLDPEGPGIASKLTTAGIDTQSLLKELEQEQNEGD